MVTLHKLVINCVFKRLEAAMLEEQPISIFGHFFLKWEEKAFFVLDSACIKILFKYFDFIALLNDLLGKIYIQFRK